MTPLHSHWEYTQALRVCEVLQKKGNMTGLSENEKKEYRELQRRLIRYDIKNNRK